MPSGKRSTDNELTAAYSFQIPRLVLSCLAQLKLSDLVFKENKILLSDVDDITTSYVNEYGLQGQKP